MPTRASPSPSANPGPGPGPSPGPWPWILTWALLGLLVAAWLARVPLQGIAHVQDEIVYQLQARILSEGHLWEAARLPRAAHVFSFVWNEAPSAAFPQGRRFGIFPNGWPAVLALGTRLGLPWLVNPLLHGLLVVVGAALAWRGGGRRAAWLAAPLLALSPGLLLQAGSRMSHPLCALLAAVALLLLLRGPSRGHALGLGAALGLLLLTRPMDALAIGGVLGLAALVRGEVRGWLLALAPIALAVGLALLQNRLYTGSATTFAQDAWFATGEPPFADPRFRFAAGCNALGFGPSHGCSPTFGTLGHTLGKGLYGAWHDLHLAAQLWIGAWPALLLALAAALEPRARRLLALAAAGWFALAAGYSLYWYAGPCLGGRFHHAAAPAVLAATACGLAALSRRLRLSAATGLLLVPLTGWRMARALPELPGYWGVDDRLATLEAGWTQGPALMLVAYSAPFQVHTPLPETAGSTMNISAIERRGDWIERRGGPLVYAEYQPALVQTLQAAHPDLPTWLLVLGAEPSQDRVLPLPPVEEPQLADLPLPVDPIPWAP